MSNDMYESMVLANHNARKRIREERKRNRYKKVAMVLLGCAFVAFSIVMLKVFYIDICFTFMQLFGGIGLIMGGLSR